MYTHKGYTDCVDGQSPRLAYCDGEDVIPTFGSACPRKSIRSMLARRDPSIRGSLGGGGKVYSLFLIGLIECIIAQANAVVNRKNEIFLVL